MRRPGKLAGTGMRAAVRKAAGSRQVCGGLEARGNRQACAGTEASRPAVAWRLAETGRLAGTGGLVRLAQTSEQGAHPVGEHARALLPRVHEPTR